MHCDIIKNTTSGEGLRVNQLSKTQLYRVQLSGIRKGLLILVSFCLVIVLSACSEQLGRSSESDDSRTRSNNQIQITAIPDVDAFEQTVYPLLAQNCNTCHGTGGFASPNIAHSVLATAHSETVDTQKVNLLNPGNSRIVVKLRNDFHYCWAVCEDDANALQAAIDQWVLLVSEDQGGGDPGAGGAPAVPLPPADLIASKPLTLADGLLDTGPKRFDDYVIAMYEFKEGEGAVAYDTSGVAPALDLALEGPTWAGGQGLDLQSGMAIGSVEASRKLYDEIAAGPTATQEFSVEAWIIPGNLTQEGPARIVSYSDGTRVRNFTVGQQTYNYVFRNRSRANGIRNNGTPALMTNDADRMVETNLQHVVMTFDQTFGRKIYVNGSITGLLDSNGPGLLDNWDPSYRFIVGNETTGNRLFMGITQMVAIHKRALTPAQILQNFESGVGEKFILQFDVSDLLGRPGSLIQFEVSELDGYSYLFNKPVFVSQVPNGFRIKNIQIAVNGQIPVAGQTWRNIDINISTRDQSLSNMAALISKDAGPEIDQFAVIFEVLGDKENIAPPVTLAPPNPVGVLDNAPRAGIRTFEQITHTMATITGVDARSESVNRTYQELKQQLPSTTNIGGFLASHQVGIAKLSLEYCDALVESPTLRDQFFGVGRFDFDAPVNTAFANQANVANLIQVLNDKIAGIALTNQPGIDQVGAELSSLISDLTAGCINAAQCDAVRTKSIVKASCAAVLGSAALLIQ